MNKEILNTGLHNYYNSKIFFIIIINIEVMDYFLLVPHSGGGGHPPLPILNCVTNQKWSSESE
jgi:hypothetical protein